MSSFMKSIYPFTGSRKSFFGISSILCSFSFYFISRSKLLLFVFNGMEQEIWIWFYGINIFWQDKTIEYNRKYFENQNCDPYYLMGLKVIIKVYLSHIGILNLYLNSEITNNIKSTLVYPAYCQSHQQFIFSNFLLSV